jgi:hypothetical protein
MPTVSMPLGQYYVPKSGRLTSIATQDKRLRGRNNVIFVIALLVGHYEHFEYGNIFVNF